MYEYTDKVIRYMRKKFIRLFNQFNGLTSFDELNVIQSSKSLYEELEKITEESLLLIAKRAYKDQSGKFADAISVAWLLGLPRVFLQATIVQKKLKLLFVIGLTWLHNMLSTSPIRQLSKPILIMMLRK